MLPDVLKNTVSSRCRPYLFLLLLTVAALFVHGYHPAAEDAEIYIPGIKKLLYPALYPFGTEFFLNHARLTLFDELIAASVRLSHLSFDLTIFLWYAASIFLTLLACWQLSGECFTEHNARWGGVVLVAALLTLPVAGTSLYIADPYLTSRSLSTFALLFAVWNAWKERHAAWMAWSAAALCIHPLMGVFGISYALLLLSMKRRGSTVAKMPTSFPLAIPLAGLITVSSDAYRVAVRTRSYFFILQWQWYEWAGIFAPLVLLWLFSRISRKNKLPASDIISRSLIVYSLFYFVAAMVLTIPERFQTLVRFQPMRSLHLLYILLFLLGGGLLGKWVLKRYAWRWIVLFLPVCGVMYFVQRQLFPTSPHIEWPGVAQANDWLQAFDWIRRNTPIDALFAINPNYMEMDDQHGFRAMAERSRLADAIKDSGAVTMFPDLPSAEHWLEQTRAQRGWEHFQKADFLRLNQIYGVSWIVIERSATITLDCPYKNPTLRVCRVN